MSITLDQARQVKLKARDLARAAVPGAATGIAKIDGSYVVKINLPHPTTKALPKSLDGVPLHYEVVGAIKALAPH